VSALLDGGKADCATLAPLVKAKLRDLESGQVLEVISGEPSAEQDIASWSRLTGNPLLGTRTDGAGIHFYVSKK
jgi:tRNA 2-thiouridine synthesizing protein A